MVTNLGFALLLDILMDNAALEETRAVGSRMFKPCIMVKLVAKAKVLPYEQRIPNP